MRKTWRRAKPKEEKRFRANHQIRVPEVFLINEENTAVGVVPISKALQMASEAGLDLIEVNPTASPPVVKILDFGQFKYEQEKKSKSSSKSKKAEQKEIRLTVRISPHDLNMRVEQGRKFLEKGHPLKAELLLKGRERQHPEKGAEVMKKFAALIESTENIKVEREQDLTKKGERFSIILVRKPIKQD